MDVRMAVKVFVGRFFCISFLHLGGRENNEILQETSCPIHLHIFICKGGML